jgi:hypothetical protein
MQTLESGRLTKIKKGKKVSTKNKQTARLSSFSSSLTFSTRKMLVFVAVFAPIAVYIMVRTLAATPNALPGDVNGDSTVNTIDLSIVLSNFGKTATQSSDPNADINADGIISINDLSVVLSNYGKVVTPPTSGKPNAPCCITITPGDARLYINWSYNPSDDIAYFALRRSTDLNSDPATWTRLPDNFTSNTAIDAPLTNGTTYYYYVTAVSSTGQISDRSSVVGGTPNGPVTPPPTPPPTTPPPTTPPPSTGGNPTPTGTKVFDGTHLSSWPHIDEAASDRVTEVPDPLGQLTTPVLKFSVNDSDTILGQPNPRAQITTNNFINEGNEVWWGGKILFPSTFPTPSNNGWISLASIYGPPYAGASPAPIQVVKGVPDSSPTWGIINPTWTSRYWGFPLSSIKGKWMNYLVHEKFSTSGWMEVWVNGQLVMPRRNIATRDSSNDQGANYVKISFYRLKGLFPGTVTLYHAQFGVWKVN